MLLKPISQTIRQILRKKTPSPQPFLPLHHISTTTHPRSLPQPRYLYPLSSKHTTTSTTILTSSTLPRLHRTLFIQTETTPNSDALKFLPGTRILPPSTPSLEYLSGRTSHSSPLARKLFSLDGISSIFYGPDFITVTKTPDATWSHLKPEVFSLITESLTSGEPIILLDSDGKVLDGEGGSDDTKINEGDSEVVSMIKELLDTRIRPAIQEDGGDIEYRGFDPEKGEVFLKLRGACRTCDSSTVTLRNGIESMLMHYIEEVKTVTQVMDQEEEVAIKEFERFEQRLREAQMRSAGGGFGGE